MIAHYINKGQSHNDLASLSSLSKSFYMGAMEYIKEEEELRWARAINRALFGE